MGGTRWDIVQRGDVAAHATNIEFVKALGLGYSDVGVVHSEMYARRTPANERSRSFNRMR